jgi:hypothetical protein
MTVQPEAGSPQAVEMRALRVIVGLSVLAIAAIVALRPGVVYTREPRAILYLLVALLPAILFAAEARAQFTMRLPMFAATAGGAAAIVLILLVTLTSLSKPEEQIAVFEIVDESGEPIAGLDRVGAVEVPRTASGNTPKPLVDRNSVVIIFPEQSPTVSLLIRPVLNGPVYRAEVSYAGKRQSKLVLGRDLVAGQR